MSILITSILWFGLIVICQNQSVKLNSRFHRIANGIFFNPNSYPFVVGLKIVLSDKKVDYCTGTLLSPLYVLTAAHCISTFKSVEVFRSGPKINFENIRTVVEFTKHPNYNEFSMIADLCLMKMNRPFENINNYAKLSQNFKVIPNRKSLDCVILGIGKQTVGFPKKGAQLAMVKVNYGPNACLLPSDNTIVSNAIKESWKFFLCPEPNSSMACVGDSGGALICQDFLLGVTSHAYYYLPGMSHQEMNCGDSRVQTRYVFVNKYLKWIQNIALNEAPNLKYNSIILILFLKIISFLK
ncbi:kallikrein-6-like [Daktulosphaira vitifoliae]|uniref:kallikrein-6-like n=1 Tax=Daktulosphaira vitifoliae TaxID=58002 RepID=UPI0021AA4B2F|nr:kallikrein-6-like [Daktulosphaira vitifoliae]